LPTVDKSRVENLGKTIARIPRSFFRTLDESGSYRNFLSLARSYRQLGRTNLDRALALSGLLAGLVNYQQRDPERTIWQPLENLLREANFPDSVDQIRSIGLKLSQRGRFADQKTSRLQRLFESGFTEWFWNLEGLRANPDLVWKKLARNLGDSPVKKTIVMAMKAFDMETLAVTNEYLVLPPEFPIMVDTRVAFITRCSGLITNLPQITSNRAAGKYRELIIDAWSEVVRKTRLTSGSWLSAIRLDTLVWRAARLKDKLTALSDLTSKGLDPIIANAVVHEFYLNG
jgi:N-glycosylase/DNA lyase